VGHSDVLEYEDRFLPVRFGQAPENGSGNFSGASSSLPIFE